jgi:hypothetical protein
MTGAQTKPRKGFSDEQEDAPQTKAPNRHWERKDPFGDGLFLRGKNVPFDHEVTDESLHDGLITKVSVGTLAPPGVYLSARRKGDGEIGNVQHAGGYQWDAPVMRSDVVQYRAKGRDGKHGKAEYRIPGQWFLNGWDAEVDADEI